MGLAAGAIEDRGIRTVCLSTFEAIMKQVDPPRRVSLPFPLGFPLGEALRPDLQTAVLRQAFRALDAEGPGPVTLDWDPEGAP